MREVGREVGDGWQTAHAPPPDTTTSWGQPRRVASRARNGQSAPSQHRLRAARRTRARFGAVAASALAAAVLVLVAQTGGGKALRPANSMRTAAFEIDKALAWAGFGLDQISVSGHRFTPDGDILDALDLGTARTWLDFDGRAARDRIERLPWIATATLTRSYPGRLDVRVTERKAFGIWSHGSRATLIDVTGRTLSDIRPGVEGVAKLPRFMGAGAEREAAAITDLAGRHPAIQSRLAVAERVAQRRWTLHLVNGTQLHLPPDREAMVLNGLGATADLMRLIEEPGRVVDLRAPGRIAVRAKSGSTATAQPPAAPRLASGDPR